MYSATTRHAGDLLFATQVGRHTIAADVPPAAGGQDRGPGGLQLLLAALSACTASMVVIFGQRLGADTTAMTVEVSGERLSDPIRLSDLQVTVHLPNCPDAALREAVRQAAEHCPVHETMLAFDGLTLTVVE